MHRMKVTMPKDQVEKIDQYRELESRNVVIKKALREFIIKRGERYKCYPQREKNKG